MDAISDQIPDVRTKLGCNYWHFSLVICHPYCSVTFSVDDALQAVSEFGSHGTGTTFCTRLWQTSKPNSSLVNWLGITGFNQRVYALGRKYLYFIFTLHSIIESEIGNEVLLIARKKDLYKAKHVTKFRKTFYLHSQWIQAAIYGNKIKN